MLTMKSPQYPNRAFIDPELIMLLLVVGFIIAALIAHNKESEAAEQRLRSIEIKLEKLEGQ